MQDSVNVEQRWRQKREQGKLTMNKQVRVGFRLTEDEKESLEKKAAKDGLKLSKYLRNIIKNMDGIFSLTESQISLFQDEFENINRLGSNVHQITRRLNIRYKNNTMGDDDYYLIKPEEVKILREELSQVGQEIVALKRQLSDVCREHKVD